MKKIDPITGNIKAMIIIITITERDPDISIITHTRDRETHVLITALDQIALTKESKEFISFLNKS